MQPLEMLALPVPFFKLSDLQLLPPPQLSHLLDRDAFLLTLGLVEGGTLGGQLLQKEEVLHAHLLDFEGLAHGGVGVRCQLVVQIRVGEVTQVGCQRVQVALERIIMIVGCGELVTYP